MVVMMSTFALICAIGQICWADHKAMFSRLLLEALLLLLLLLAWPVVRHRRAIISFAFLRHRAVSA